jgi:glutamate synthase domain-containing protein 2
MEVIGYFVLFIVIVMFIYDKYIQRKHQLLINYPVIGRLRYFFEALREPFRQYFGDEDFYESKDKVDWVYNAAYDKVGFASFSPTQTQPNPKFLIKHSNTPLNDDEVDDEFPITFGEKRKYPYVSKSIIARSAMSDGAISPEGTRAFTKGAYDGNFAINTGEGSLTTNFFFTHKDHSEKYMNRIKVKGFDKTVYKFISTFFNRYMAIKYLRNKLFDKKEVDTYIFDYEDLVFFRPNWSAALENFPKEVPKDMPDIIFQMSSGLYGVRDEKGNFDPVRYQKTMSFCKMTEIKLAQGAKQTGGKLAKEKVSDSIAYFRGVKAHEQLMSPNRFPYASSATELFDFIAQLQELSGKPVGFKIVISSVESIEPYVVEMKRRKEQGLPGNPDFITVDGGDGGSATAPLFLMYRVGFHIKDAIHIVNNTLKDYGLREEVKLIAGSKILTPDDVVIALALGADYINIARGFMMSAGCIRARMCSGHGTHQCPVGLATADPDLRRTYLVYKHAQKITSYHNNLVKGIKVVLAVMGLKNVEMLHRKHLTFIDKNGFIYADINRYLDKKMNV